jgi:hypothetical protein
MQGKLSAMHYYAGGKACLAPAIATFTGVIVDNGNHCRISKKYASAYGEE